MIKVEARRFTVQVLARVEGEGAYSNVLLQKNLGDLEDARDRHLATLLVNGVLKHRLTLDYALRRHLQKPLSSLPYEVRGILRVGAFQILYLDKIPPAVAIYESVEMAKERQPRFAGLVNVVLRKVLDQGWQLQWPDSKKDPVRYLSVRYSHPEWMVRRWWKRWGVEETTQLCQINNEPAPLWLRTNTLKISRAELSQRLVDEGIQVESGLRTPESLRVSNGGAIERLRSFQEGLFTVQDESSQLVAHVLDPLPGQVVLDTCAAPGGKTTHLAQKMQNTGAILAYDIYEHKLELIAELSHRLGISIIQERFGDARELSGVEDNSCQRVLVDAPCSGLGVLRRKADMRWQKQEQELKQLPQLQLEILENAGRKVAEGGEIVYSTCTIEPEENFEVIKNFRARHPEFEPVDLTEVLPFDLTSDRDINQAKKGMIEILPHLHGMDGFFIAKLRRRQV